MENPIKMDDLGGKPHYFRKHPYNYALVDLNKNQKTYQKQLMYPSL